ncbi:hypothetical protein CAP39_05665 [Sphingomonas sp. IBVSS1]|nr:hypothetical protein CAP39_05665 [Sphingomonas sp. IBVSS1]
MISQFGEELPLRWVVILAVWGAVAVFLAIRLRRAHPSFVKLLAQLWLSMAAGAVSYVWWIEHG